MPVYWPRSEVTGVFAPLLIRMIITTVKTATHTDKITASKLVEATSPMQSTNKNNYDMEVLYNA